MRALDLDAIEARAEAATKGPWVETPRSQVYGGIVSLEVSADDDEMDGYGGRLIAESIRRSDKAFIAHAREDIPALIAEVKRLREAVSA